MSTTLQQQGVYVHGAKVIQSPVHGGLIPIHGGHSPLHGANGSLALGPELVVNGAFGVDTSSWTAGNGGTLSVVANRLRVTSTVGGALVLAEQIVAVVPGAQYALSYSSFAGTGLAWFMASTATNNGNMHNDNSVAGLYQVVVQAISASIFLDAVCNAGGVPNATADFDDISLKRIL